MRLTTIGTGSVPPSPTRVNPGHLVEAGPVRLLMDCGSGVVHRMATLGLGWAGVTHVALTHFDQDHTSDLAALFLAWRYGQLPPRAEPVTVLGPPGTRARLELIAAALWDKLLAPGYPVHVHELPAGGTVALGDATLRSYKVPHTAESVAYSVEHGGRRLVYTGDTASDEALGVWAAGCDLLLAECSLPEEMAVASHLTPERVGRLAAAAGAARLVLTHFYPPVERVDVRALVARHNDGPVELAHDGWQTDV